MKELGRMDEKSKLFLQINENRPAIMAVIVAMVRDFNVSDDIFQDTIVEILENAERVQGAGNFLLYAKGIARNMVLRHWRDKKKLPVTTDQSVLEILADAASEETPQEAWHREKIGLRHCLDKLPEPRRKLFVLRYGRNLKGDQLAKEAGVNISSLRTTLARIRQLLRECIDSFILRSEQEGLAGES